MVFPVKISVLMPVYNTDVSFLQEAVSSILDQSLQDFEFIIIDDGSVGDTTSFLNELEKNDERVRLIRNRQNLGITKSLNIGLKAARGKYIARMDSDDIAMPPRFEKQYAFMERHPDVILCGSRVEYLGDRHGLSSGKWRRKIENMDDYRVRLLFDNPGPHHPSIFIRHEGLIKYHILYDESLPFAQDYGLFSVISRYGRVVTMDDVLMRYRVHDSRVSTKKKEQQMYCATMVKKRLLSELMDVTDADMEVHCFYSANHMDAKITPEAAEWYQRILAANARRHLYKGRKLKRHIERIKRRLVAHTFTNEMSFAQKAILAARYVSPTSMVKMIVEKKIGGYD